MIIEFFFKYNVKKPQVPSSDEKLKTAYSSYSSESL